MSLTTEFVCTVCRSPFAAYRPSRETVERPICPMCMVTTFEGVTRFFRYDKLKNETTAASGPQEKIQ